MDALWITEREENIGTSLLANDFGVGKTYTYQMAVLLAAIRQEKRASVAGAPEPEYRPTLLVVPNAILEQVYRESTNSFGPELTIKVYYGSRDTTRDPDMRMDVIDKDKFCEYMDSLSEATRNSRVCTFLYISMSLRISTFGRARKSRRCCWY